MANDTVDHLGGWVPPLAWWVVELAEQQFSMGHAEGLMIEQARRDGVSWLPVEDIYGDQIILDPRRVLCMWYNCPMGRARRRLLTQVIEAEGDEGEEWRREDGEDDEESHGR